MKFGDVVTAMTTLAIIDILLDAVLLLVFSFIGLYAGSMLRKPKKS